MEVETGASIDGIKIPLVLYDVGTVCDDLIYYSIEQYNYSLPRSWYIDHNLSLISCILMLNVDDV